VLTSFRKKPEYPLKSPRRVSHSEVEFPPKGALREEAKYREEQIVRILKEVEAGAKVGEDLVLRLANER
jgi:hypothetical protein